MVVERPALYEERNIHHASWLVLGYIVLRWLNRAAGGFTASQRCQNKTASGPSLNGQCSGQKEPIQNQTVPQNKSCGAYCRCRPYEVVMILLLRSGNLLHALDAVSYQGVQVEVVSLV